jgi:D-glycero-alpha-D-manno-heptose-7-phosphate kinase
MAANEAARGMTCHQPGEKRARRDGSLHHAASKPIRNRGGWLRLAPSSPLEKSRAMSVIKASAPTRVDLAGGTLDLWPLSMLVDAAITVNCAISVRTGCELEPWSAGWRFEPRGLAAVDLASLPRRPERELPGTVQLAAVVATHFDLPPCRIVTWSDARPGSGLGGSSALIISLIAAAAKATGSTLSDAEAVALACNLETRVLGLPAGSQDHWAAQCGGLAILEYRPEGVTRAPVSPAAISLAECLVVADTNVEHHSGMNNWSVFKAVLERDAGACAALADVSLAAALMRDALVTSPPSELFGLAREALRAEWAARRRLSPAVSSPEVERIVAAAESVGGAAKVCGAGGGGCVACLPAEPSDRRRLAAAVAATGARILDARPCAAGVQVS